MKQEKLEYLQKKYESRLTPADEKMLEKQAQPKSGPGHKHAGHLAAGKPKNMKKTMGRLFSYISDSKWKLLLVIICIIAGTAANLAGSYVLRPIINGLASEN